MMELQYFLFIIMGISAGALVAAGLVALITTTGVITRMAEKTHTAHFVKGYETIIVVGGVLWNLFWVFGISLPLTNEISIFLQVIIGLCQGIFVGCLAVSLAEALNGTAIFGRRVKLAWGAGTIILFMALGKMVYSLLQFLLHLVKA